MTRILIVATEYPPMKAGVANLCHSVYTEFRRRGEDVYLLAPVGSTVEEPDRQFPVYVRSGASFPWPDRIANSLRLRRLVRAKGIGTVLYMDAAARIHSFPWTPRVATGVYLNGTELVRRSALGEFLSGRFWMQSRALRAADSVICISKATQELFTSLFPGLPSTIVYPAYDEKRASDTAVPPPDPYPPGADPRPLTFLTVSRLTRRKGHDIVLEMLARLRDRLPPFRYAIVGEGPERGKIQGLAENLGLSERVHFAGAVDDAALGAYYRHADIFIMLSRKSPEGIEGFGLTYVEASASGTPAVGSDHGGCVEAVRHGVSGLSLPLDDLPAADAALLDLARDEAKRRRMGEDGRRWVREAFSGEAMYHAFRAALDAGEARARVRR